MSKLFVYNNKFQPQLLLCPKIDEQMEKKFKRQQYARHENIFYQIYAHNK